MQVFLIQPIGYNLRITTLGLNNTANKLVMILLKFKKLERYYHLYQENNLFGKLTLVCTWGVFDSKRGGHKLIICENQLEVDSHLLKISKVRFARKYQLY